MANAARCVERVVSGGSSCLAAAASCVVATQTTVYELSEPHELSDGVQGHLRTWFNMVNDIDQVLDFAPVFYVLSRLLRFRCGFHR
jgi:hypothetical protein